MQVNVNSLDGSINVYASAREAEALMLVLGAVVDNTDDGILDSLFNRLSDTVTTTDTYKVRSEPNVMFDPVDEFDLFTHNIVIED